MGCTGMRDVRQSLLSTAGPCVRSFLYDACLLKVNEAVACKVGTWRRFQGHRMGRFAALRLGLFKYPQVHFISTTPPVGAENIPQSSFPAIFLLSHYFIQPIDPLANPNCLFSLLLMEIG